MRLREHEVQAAKHDADRLWLRSFTPADRHEYLLDRLDKAAELTAQNIGASEDFLEGVLRNYFESLDGIREPAALIEGKAA